MAGTPQPARIAVFGAGYVGLVTAAGFADLGHLVAVRDVVPEKIEALRGGRVPIYEPGLDELLERNRERLSFTLDVGEAIAGAEFVYVCVDTPPTYSGDADLSRVWTVVDELPQVTWVERPLLVMKSTVPVGTGEKVRHALDARGFRHVGYVANPEFTAEGSAVEDFRKPDRIVIGAFEEADGDRVEALHAEIDAPVVRADVNSAEMVKLASNAFLMTRISFINEIANVCEATGADVVQVARGIGLDHRLGPHFLRAGIGYGGSCLLGHETVLVRQEGRKRLVTLAALYEETEPGARVEILSWRPDGEGAEILPVELLTPGEYDGEVVEVRTKMGRRVRCTPDHVFVTEEGRKLAQELTSADWLPIAQGVRVEERPRPRRLNVLGGFESAGLNANDVIVRPYRRELELIGAREIQETLGPLGHHRGVVARSHDIRRAGALRLDGAAALDLELEEASFGTARNGTYVPASIPLTAQFWRVVGLYLAEGHSPRDGEHGHHRLEWSFHPRDEDELVEEVAGFWRSLGVKATVFEKPPSKVVRVSSRLLATWWLGAFGLGANCYEQRLPDLVWDESDEHKRALLAGLWLGDGSWSHVSGGPSVVLEYGAVSRELADGMLRLLGEPPLAAPAGQADRTDRLPAEGECGVGPRNRPRPPSPYRPCLLARGAADAHVRDDRRPRRLELLPEGLARAQAARLQLGLPLPAPERGDRGQRAPETARDREAEEAPRLAPRDDRRAARARVQAVYRRRARGAVDRPRVAPARGGRRGARVGSGGPAARAAAERDLLRDAPRGGDRRGRGGDRDRVAGAA